MSMKPINAQVCVCDEPTCSKRLGEYEGDTGPLIYWADGDLDWVRQHIEDNEWTRIKMPDGVERDFCPEHDPVCAECEHGYSWTDSGKSCAAVLEVGEAPQDANGNAASAECGCPVFKWKESGNVQANA